MQGREIRVGRVRLETAPDGPRAGGAKPGPCRAPGTLPKSRAAAGQGTRDSSNPLLETPTDAPPGPTCSVWPDHGEGHVRRGEDTARHCPFPSSLVLLVFLHSRKKKKSIPHVTMMIWPTGQVKHDRSHSGAGVRQQIVLLALRSLC